MRPQQLGKTAFMPGIEMLNDHQRQAGLWRERVQKVLERSETSGGSADADHKKRVLGRSRHPGSIGRVRNECTLALEHAECDFRDRFGTVSAAPDSS